MGRFNELAKEWDAKPRRLLLAENIYKGIKEKVELTKEMKVLDIGTGTGLLLIHMVDEIGQITGVDNSEGMLEMLQEKIEKTNLSNADYFLYDAETDLLPISDYDMVISSMTFHHFTKPNEVLKDVYKSLKPGGRVCIGDLDKEDGSFHSDNLADDVKHFGFEKETFNKWLQEAGFENTSVEEIFRVDKNDTQYPVFLAFGEKPKN
jgi:ubiquinone/menaquinone biosynthesis C-methylase UbiE